MKDYAEKNYHRKTNWATTLAAVLFVALSTVWFAYKLVEELAR